MKMLEVKYVFGDKSVDFKFRTLGPPAGNFESKTRRYVGITIDDHIILVQITEDQVGVFKYDAAGAKELDRGGAKETN